MNKLSFAILLWAVGPASADDWPAFRGPHGDGRSKESRLPTTWGPDKNVKWKAALPQWGNGSPVVSRGRVFVTSAEDPEGRKRSLYAFDRKDGKQLWVRTVEVARTMPTHGTNGYCPTTPAADGERVVVFEGVGGLRAYDYDGKPLWSRELGEFEHHWGDGISPVIHDGKVILHGGPGKSVFLAAFDATSGKTLWQVEEKLDGNGERNSDGKYTGSWCTPLITTVGGRAQAVVAWPTRIVGVDVASGKIVWSCEGVRHKKGDLAYSSPIVSGDVLMVVGGFNGPSLGVRLGGAGDVTSTHRLWRIENQPQSIGSGIAVDGHFYVPMAGQNRIDCLDPKTGQALWQHRAEAAFWGSIVYGAGHAFVTDQQGTTLVFKPNPKAMDLVATNRLGEKCNATPALSDGQIFIRTFKALYCIGE